MTNRFIKTLFFIIILNAISFPKVESAEINTSVKQIPSSDARTIQGSIQLTKAETEYIQEFKAFSKLPLKFTLDTSYIGIENSTNVELPAHLNKLAATIEAFLPFFSIDKAYLGIGISPSFYGDSWDFESSDFRIPARAFIIYQPQEQKITYMLGVAVFPDYEGKIIPLLGIIYKPNDKLTLNLTPKNPNINYKLNNKISLFSEFGVVRNEYEVTKGSFNSAVLQYKERYLGAGIRYQLNNYLEGSFSAGEVFKRAFKYRDSLGKVTIENGPYLEAKITVKL